MSKEIILQYSGGKDSRACMELLIPVKEKVLVHFLDTGYMFPHVLDNVYTTCNNLGFDLVTIKPPSDIVEYQAEYGLPSDILSTWNNIKIWNYLFHKPDIMLQDAMECCFRNIMAPLHIALLESGIKQCWRGSKEKDSRVGVPHGYQDEHGITYFSPLWDYTDEGVFSFLKSRGVDVLDHYALVKDSTQCWHCTADLHFGGGDRIKFTRENYPTLYEFLEPRVKAVVKEVRRQVGFFEDAIGVSGVK